jgi:hypothetical protein
LSRWHICSADDHLVVSHRGGGPTSTAAQITLGEAITWVAAGCCLAVLATMASAIVGLVGGEALRLVVFAGVYIGAGFAVRRCGWRRLAAFVAGIGLIYCFVAIAFVAI